MRSNTVSFVHTYVSFKHNSDYTLINVHHHAKRRRELNYFIYYIIFIIYILTNYYPLAKQSIPILLTFSPFLLSKVLIFIYSFYIPLLFILVFSFIFASLLHSLVSLSLSFLVLSLPLSLSHTQFSPFLSSSFHFLLISLAIYTMLSPPHLSFTLVNPL